MATVGFLDRSGGARLRLRTIAEAANVAIPKLHSYEADQESLSLMAQAGWLPENFSEIARGR